MCFKKSTSHSFYRLSISRANRWSFKLSLLDLKKEHSTEYIKQISVVLFFFNAVELWWERDCCSMPNDHFFSYMYIMARTSILDHEWDDDDDFCLDMLLHSDTLSWFPTNQYLFLLLTVACLGAIRFCTWISDQICRELSHAHFYQGWFQLA